MPHRTIDLNADVGEATDVAGLAVERTLMGLVTSVHVACGGHAGDDDTMQATVAAALEHDVGVGAHPSYPDRAGFGRQPMDIDRAELGASLARQLRALDRDLPHGRHDRPVGEGPRRALRRGGEGRRGVRDLP